MIIDTEHNRRLLLGLTNDDVIDETASALDDPETREIYITRTESDALAIMSGTPRIAQESKSTIAHAGNRHERRKQDAEGKKKPAGKKRKKGKKS